MPKKKKKKSKVKKKRSKVRRKTTRKVKKKSKVRKKTTKKVKRRRIKVNKENFQSNGHIMVATKYKNTVINFFANKGVRAECIKLNGAIELAPRLGICSTIVDLVSTGRTLQENNLRESDVLLEITSKLIVNKISYKIMNSEISKIITKFSRIING